MKKRSTGVSQAHEACSLSASCTAAIPLEVKQTLLLSKNIHIKQYD